MIFKYGVIGHPIAHSRSPDIHLHFAKQENVELSYEKILSPLDGFAHTAQQFFHQGGLGVNITVPFKHEAFLLADTLTERAQAAQSVNTLKKMPDGTLLGDTTDGEGIICDIQDNLNFSITQKHVLILGAGGAVASIIEPLLLQRPASLVIVNRTLNKAQDLANRFAHWGAIKATSYDDLPKHKEAFDLVINGTSSSLHEEQLPLPNDLFGSTSMAYDMFYGSKPTSFLVWAQQHGAQYLADGLGMLIEQAAASYYLWQGFMPNTQNVITQLRAHLAQEN
ncbi:shikimate dehydrogenase [Neisseria sp. Ec49-e6-T10]|uniref:shikimate dehydrogenase n=1 Tax=Neisseria sp. Ec49-e6-T10 TaxID=3140744 RepID=UPI003EB7C8DC